MSNADAQEKTDLDLEKLARETARKLWQFVGWAGKEFHYDRAKSEEEVAAMILRFGERVLEEAQKEIQLWKDQAAFENEHREKYRQRLMRLLGSAWTVEYVAKFFEVGVLDDTIKLIADAHNASLSTVEGKGLTP